jgi:hypothetical protein
MKRYKSVFKENTKKGPTLEEIYDLAVNSKLQNYLKAVDICDLKKKQIFAHIEVGYVEVMLNRIDFYERNNGGSYIKLNIDDVIKLVYLKYGVIQVVTRYAIYFLYMVY